MVTIGWLNTNDSDRLQSYDGMAMSPYLTYDPEPYKRTPGHKEKSYKKWFTVCPANVQYNRNLFVIRAPLSVSLEVKELDKQKGIWDCMPLNNNWTMTPEALARYVMFEGMPDARSDLDKPILQVRTPYVFYADQPVTLQLLPVTNSIFQPPGITICGEFDIHAWQRPVQWGFEWWDTNKPLIIKRGDPLYYIKFIVNNDPTEKVKLVRLKANDNTIKPILKANNVAHFASKTFDLFDIARKWRAPKYVTKENLWQPGD